MSQLKGGTPAWGFILCALLGGCSDYNGISEPIKMTVIEVYEDRSPMGCMGTNWKTLVRSQDGRTEQLCGKWGSKGDVIAGCWVRDAADHWRNGFRRVC